MPIINKKENKPDKTTYKKDNQSSKYYNSREWHIIRAYFKINRTLCVDCAMKGIYKDYAELHHKVPFLTGKTEEERWELFTDLDNIVPLCKECHIERHKQLRKNAF